MSGFVTGSRTMIITRMAPIAALILSFAASADAQTANSGGNLRTEAFQESDLPLGAEPCSQPFSVLLDALKSEDHVARWAATECLEDTKDRRATEPFVDALLTDRGDVHLRLHQWAALRSLDDPHTADLLLKALNASETHWEAAYSLGNLRITRGVAPLLEMLISGNPDDRILAAESLGAMKDIRAIDPLSAALLNPQSKLRCAAAEALGRIGNDRALTALLNTLNDPDSNLRRISAEALGDIKNASAVPALAQKLTDLNEDRYVVMYSAEALGKIADPSAVSALISGLYYGRRDAQWHSAHALASIERPEAKQALVSSLRRGNVNVVAAVYREFIRMGDDSFVPSLVEALDAYGDVYMARDYVNSGNARLAEAARSSRFASDLDEMDAADFSWAIWGSGR
jgi:HEAT repeat protein